MSAPKEIEELVERFQRYQENYIFFGLINENHSALQVGKYVFGSQLASIFFIFGQQCSVGHKLRGTFQKNGEKL